MPDTHPSGDQLFPVRADFASRAYVDQAGYRARYERAARDPDGYWAEEAKRIAWMQPPTKIKNTSVQRRCLDQMVRGRHAECLGLLPRPASGRRAATRRRSSGKATIRAVSAHVTYRQLHEQVCRLANAMRGLGVKKGDVVTIYLPMVVEAAVAMLACTRIGAIHSVVFGGFSPDSLANRIQDCGSKMLITADEGRRGGRKVPLKANADEALKICPTVHRRDRRQGDRRRRRHAERAATTTTPRCARPPRPIARPRR